MNCVLLAMDNHGVKDGSAFRAALDGTDIAFAAFFALEAVLKIIAWGLWWCGKGCVVLVVSQSLLIRCLEYRKCNHFPYFRDAYIMLTCGCTKHAALSLVCVPFAPPTPDVLALVVVTACRSYFRSQWNCLDFFVVVVSILAVAFPQVSVLRSFRALRPLRLLVRSQSMQVRVTPQTCPSLLHRVLQLYTSPPRRIHL